MIRYKSGVPRLGLSVEMKKVLPEIEAVYKELGARNLWITSTSDGKHQRDSKHYEVPCDAIDTRIWDILRAIARRISKELGPDYDVVFEGDHFHIEYDPKG